MKLKLSIGTIIIYFLLKYIILGFIMVIELHGHDFFDNIIGYCELVLFFYVMPIGFPIIIILTYPMYLLNKVKSIYLASFLLLLIFLVELVIYSFWNSNWQNQIYNKELIINLLLGISIWSLFFSKEFFKSRKKGNKYQNFTV